MTTLKEKIESHWLRLAFILVIATITATSAFLYYVVIDLRNVLISEKSYQISELEEKLRFAQGQIELSQNTCQDKIDKALGNYEKISEKEIKVYNQSITEIRTEFSNSKSKLQDVTASLNALQIKYDTELAKNTELKSTLTKNEIRRRLFEEIQRLQVKERELKVLRYQVIVSIEKLIPQVAELEYNCSGKGGIIHGCEEAAIALMTLEKEKKELSWLENQIEQTNMQIITIESRI